MRTPLLTVYTFANVGINRITSATLNRQIGNLIFYLGRSIKAHRLVIKPLDENIIYHRVVEQADIKDDRLAKKAKTMAMFHTNNEHVADALMLYAYTILDRLQLL